MFRKLIPIALVCFASPSQADRANILFIMTDDQAPWAVGSFDGPTHAATPHLDTLDVGIHWEF